MCSSDLLGRPGYLRFFPLRTVKSIYLEKRCPKAVKEGFFAPRRTGLAAGSRGAPKIYDPSSVTRVASLLAVRKWNSDDGP